MATHRRPLRSDVDARDQARPRRGYWASGRRAPLAATRSRSCAALVIVLHRADGDLRAPASRRPTPTRHELRRLRPIGIAGLPARHRRARPRHAVAPDLRRAAVAVHGRDAGVRRLRRSARHRRRRRLSSAAHVNTLIMRTIDVFYAFPSVLLAIALSGALGGRHRATRMLSLTVVFIPPIAPRRRERDDAGAHPRLRRGGARLRRRRARRSSAYHVLGNVLGPIFVYATSLISVSMILASGLSFLGLGVAAARARVGPDAQHAAHRDLRPAAGSRRCRALMIFITSISFNLLSDGLRSAMDVEATDTTPAADRRRRPRRTARSPLLLEVRGLVKHFPVKRGLFGAAAASCARSTASSSTCCKGETLGIVGESGCGKSTTGAAAACT